MMTARFEFEGENDKSSKQKWLVGYIVKIMLQTNDV